MTAPVAPPTLPPLREVIARHGLAARKALGQHFLLDTNLTARIARAAADAAGPLAVGTTVEIGPGPGGLTRALLAAGAQVIAVERDARCVAALQELVAVYPDRLQVVEGDALAIDAGALGAPPRRIVANLPYNISTALLARWLQRPEAFSSFTLMFQAEVADRLLAHPRSKAYGRLSVLAQWRCEVRALFEVGPRAFTPPPKVSSTVVRLDPRPVPLAPADPDMLQRVTAAAFGQRRKMLRRSLKPLAGTLGLAVPDWLDRAGLDPTARAEDLAVADFCRLATAALGADPQRST